jgi:hypothetical protein
MKTFCHLYYDCSDPTESKICPYPKLFSEESKRCEDFKRVNCGSRVEKRNIIIIVKTGNHQ